MQLVLPRLSKDPVGFGTLEGDRVTGVPFDDEKITRNGMKTNQTWARIPVEENLTEAPQVLNESFNWQILSLGKKPNKTPDVLKKELHLFDFVYLITRSDFSFTWKADS